MIEEIQTFLAAPQISDIISFVFIIITFISQKFIKPFVKKENFKLSTSFNAGMEQVSHVVSELRKSKENYDKQAVELKEEKQRFRTCIRLICNSPDIVRSGIANKIAKIMPVTDEEKDSYNKEEEK